MRAVIGCRPCSAGIKTAVNDGTSVACPATRRDGRRRLKEAKGTVDDFGSEISETLNLKLQSAKVKIFKVEKSQS